MMRALVSTDPVVLLPDFEVEDVKHLLQILYTGQVTCSKSRADRLLLLTKVLKLNPIPISFKTVEEEGFHHPERSERVSSNDQQVTKHMTLEQVQSVFEKTVDNESSLVTSVDFKDNVKASEKELKLCYICKAVIRGHNVFLDHLRLHREEGGPYSCPEESCRTDITTGLMLHKHYADNHLRKSSEASINNSKDKIEKTVEYECKLCYLKWKIFIHFKKHMNEIHDMRPLKCGDCDQRFNDKLGLKTHVQAKHMPDEKHLCDVCLKPFSTARFLYHHRRQIHELGDSRANKCEICGFISKGSANLKKHIKTVHSTETMAYQCSYCPSRFKSKYNLTCHERIHNGDSPYSCKFCSSNFKRAHHLKGHLKVCKWGGGGRPSLENSGTHFSSEKIS